MAVELEPGLTIAVFVTCGAALCAPYVLAPRAPLPLVTRVIHHAFRLASAFVLLSTAAVLLGAPLLSAVPYRWAAVQAALSSDWVVHIVSISSAPPPPVPAPLRAAEAAALLGAWAGALVCPYDWGYEWQRWPTPSFVVAVALFWAAAAVAAATQACGSEGRPLQKKERRGSGPAEAAGASAAAASSGRKVA